MSEVRSLVDGAGRPVGSVLGADVAAHLYHLVGVLLADVLGSPVDFEDQPTSYVKVSYRRGTETTEFLFVTIDLAFHRVRLQLEGRPPIFLEPLTEPRFRLARQVGAFIAQTTARRHTLEESAGGGTYRPRRLGPRERCSQCPGSCYVMERVA